MLGFHLHHRASASVQSTRPGCLGLSPACRLTIKRGLNLSSTEISHCNALLRNSDIFPNNFQSFKKIMWEKVLHLVSLLVDPHQLVVAIPLWLRPVHLLPAVHLFHQLFHQMEPTSSAKLCICCC